jgi:hypothetical protein
MLSTSTFRTAVAAVALLVAPLAHCESRACAATPLPLVVLPTDSAAVAVRIRIGRVAVWVWPGNAQVAHLLALLAQRLAAWPRA